jgi:hypothetical protein
MEVNGTRHNLSPVEWETIFDFFGKKCCLPPGHGGLQFTNRRLTQNWNDGKQRNSGLCIRRPWKTQTLFSLIVAAYSLILSFTNCTAGAYLKLSMSPVWDLQKLRKRTDGRVEFLHWKLRFCGRIELNFGLILSTPAFVIFWLRKYQVNIFYLVRDYWSRSSLPAQC